MTLKLRLLSRIATVALVTGVLASGPATAQVAPLGFTIDPTQGVPGTFITGQVDPADVAASCVTDLAEFQAQFTVLLDEVFDVNGNPTQTELFQRFFPGQTDFIFENCDQLAYSITGLTSFGIALNVNGAAETALPQTFVLTFADLATQEPIGELSTFDPVTGTGTVVAPNLAPGSYPVVATCVEPSLDLDVLEAGIRETGDFLRSLGFTDEICDPNIPEFQAKVEELFGEGTDLFAFLEAIGPDVVQNIVEFAALGIQFFTIVTPEAGIDALIADIEALRDAGELNAGQARGLTRQLRNAARSLGSGNIEAACGQLTGFVDHVNALLAEGVLDEAAAEDLVTQAEGIQALIGCGAPGTTTTTAAPTTTTTSTTTSTTTTTAPGSPSAAFLDQDA
jgi:hypothetical protein